MNVIKAYKFLKRKVYEFLKVMTAQEAYEYANDVLKAPFPEGEDTIAKSAEYSYLYALNVINGRFPEGEDAIAMNSEYAYLYAKDVIKGRWPKGEKVIYENERYIKDYEELSHLPPSRPEFFKY